VKPSPAAADDAADDDAAADDAEDDEDEDDDAEDDEDEDEDVLAPTVYETQEFVFYLGDRNLGSYFMPVYGKAQPDSIERRMITAPTMTNVGYPMLLWVEETDDGAKTMMWSADTPAEIVEAQRLFDTAQTAQKAADAAESKETE
ncbi:MAG TPA: hypothetical protein PLR25_17900, partial [Planctomycetaceae bacterium]|nr:hypothetical protein [Planctomycetaceae bacterium]